MDGDAGAGAEYNPGMRATTADPGRAVLIAALALPLGACSLPYVPPFTPPPPAAVTHLADSAGRVVGNAVFLQDGGSVRILLDVFGVAPGSKAVHIHEVGQCDAPSFESAGAHFNPDKKQHGTGNPRGPHAGDLPNVFVEATGKGHLEFTAKRVTLKKGAHSLLDGKGTALVLHADADDMRTDPDGDSKGRVACGVIVRAQ
jgi:superoxide dismutase, Cu-Zn family